MKNCAVVKILIPVVSMNSIDWCMSSMLRTVKLNLRVGGDIMSRRGMRLLSVFRGKKLEKLEVHLLLYCRSLFFREIYVFVR